MKHIAILDSEYARVIVAKIPEWVMAECKAVDQEDSVGEVIIYALGLSSNNTQYMIYDAPDDAIVTELDLITQDFEQDLREQIKELTA